MSNTKTAGFLLLSLLVFCLIPAYLAHRSLRSNPISTVSEFLNSHNTIRAKHHLPPLKWSKHLANYAKWYAGQRRSDCNLIHSSATYGENIYWGSGANWSPKDAVAAWAVQEVYYNHHTDSCMLGKQCLHYRQLVWRNTTSVGCAKIKCRTGDTFVVCEYDPHGNVEGQRPY